MLKKTISLLILFVSNSYAAYNYMPPIQTKPDKPKLGIAKTQTEFGAMAVPEQAKRMIIVKIEEDCQFDQSLIKVDYKEPVRLIIKNQNPYPINLMFTSLKEPQTYINYYKTVPVPVSKKLYHAIKIAPESKYTLNWFFNRKKYFKWICSNKDKTLSATTEIQVGNASKISRKERLEQKKQQKLRNLPPPPEGFN